MHHGMKKRVLCIGAINIDERLGVESIAYPGQTVLAKICEYYAGGKGANQSVAIAKVYKLLLCAKFSIICFIM
jgi:ribokinase